MKATQDVETHLRATFISKSTKYCSNVVSSKLFLFGREQQKGMGSLSPCTVKVMGRQCVFFPSVSAHISILHLVTHRISLITVFKLQSKYSVQSFRKYRKNRQRTIQKITVLHSLTSMFGLGFRNNRVHQAAAQRQSLEL